LHELWLYILRGAEDAPFTSADLQQTKTLCSITAAALENAAKTEAQRNLARYLPPAVVKKLLTDGEAKLGGEEQIATIMILDIRNFTGLTEKLGAAGTVSFLNTFFAHAAPKVRQHGMVDKYLGDGFLALWGVPFADPQDADHAVEAALAILDGLEKVHPDIRIGMGITRGAVISGNVGIPERMNYTVIGAPVNAAARLEEQTKELGIPLLFSHDVYAALSPGLRERALEVQAGAVYTIKA
jgi:adenylate cyclase